MTLPHPLLVILGLLLRLAIVNHISTNQGAMEIDTASISFQQDKLRDVTRGVKNSSNNLTIRGKTEKVDLDRTLKQPKLDELLSLGSIFLGRLNATLRIGASGDGAADSREEEHKLLMLLW